MPVCMPRAPQGLWGVQGTGLRRGGGGVSYEGEAGMG